MSEEKLLKRAAIYSLFLMVCVVTLSVGTKLPKENISYASEVSSTPMPSTTIIYPKDEPVQQEIVKVEVDSKLPIPINENVKKKYGSNLIAIQKPQELGSDSLISLEDLAVDRKIVITITGVEENSILADHIYRLYEDNYHYGDIEAATPSPVDTTIEDSMESVYAEEPAFTQAKDVETSTIEPTTTPEPTPTPIPTDNTTSLNITYTTTEDKNISAVITMELIKTYAYKLEEDENYFYVCLVNPHDVYDKIIVLDAGHGGNDSGTYSKGYEYLEKDMNLDMLLKLTKYFENNENIKIYTTRTTDRRLTLNQRVNLANDLEADLFLSIHCNANVSRSIHGTEVLYNDKQNDWEGFNSKRFAQICLEELVSTIDLKNRGIVARSQNVLIIGESKVPVALVEVAFMSNTNDMNFLKQDANREKAAQGIYNGIIRAMKEQEQGKIEK